MRPSQVGTFATSCPDSVPDAPPDARAGAGKVGPLIFATRAQIVTDLDIFEATPQNANETVIPCNS